LSFRPLILIGLVFYAIDLVAQEMDVKGLLELDLEEFVQVVTASKKPQALREVPATVHVITAEKIRENGYLTLEDALADLPGFQFRNILGFNSYVFQRGIPNQNNLMLVLVDGVQINELNSGGFYGGGQFNLANVRMIEVVYGPASSLYGTNAMSGIVNIITYEPENVEGGQASVLVGDFATRNVDFRYGRYSPETDFGCSISGMFKQSGKADLGGKEGDGNWTEDMENFEDDLSFDGKLTYGNLSLGLVFQDKQASRTTNYRTTGTSYLDSGTEWHIRFVNGHLRYLYDRNEKWTAQSQFYYRNATVVDNTIAFVLADTGATGGQVGYYRPNELLGIEGKVDVRPQEKLSLVGGIVREEERLAEGFSKTYSGSPGRQPPIPPQTEMLDNHLTSLYLQAQYKLVQSAELTLGFRYDHSSFYGDVTTPRLGVVLNRKELTAKLLYMEAFRAPKPWDYTFGDGNPDLRPEEMRSVELAATYLLRENVKANLSLYRNVLEEKLTKEGNRWVNGENLNTTGLEVALEYAGRKVRPFVNYTFADSEFEGGERIPEISRHSANIGFSYAFTRKIRFGLRGNYLGGRENPKIVSSTGSDEIDAAFVLHSTLSILDHRGFDFQLIVRNLLGAEYYHTSNRPPDRYRQPQRTVMLRFGFHF